MERYVYKITEKETNRFYIGKRTSKNCCAEDDFGKTYFTSARANSWIRDSLKNEPENWIVEFLHRNVESEERLSELECIEIDKEWENPLLLNGFNPKGRGKFNLPPTEESRKRISKTIREYFSKQENIEKLKNNPKRKNRAWYTNGIENIVLKKEDSIPNGFWKGRTLPNHTEEQKQKIAESMRRYNDNLEVRKNKSEKQKQFYLENPNVMKSRFTEDVRIKMSEIGKRHFSNEEERIKQSERLKAFWNDEERSKSLREKLSKPRNS